MPGKVYPQAYAACLRFVEGGLFVVEDIFLNRDAPAGGACLTKAG
jgi:hypothetical protein